MIQDGGKPQSGEIGTRNLMFMDPCIMVKII